MTLLARKYFLLMLVTTMLVVMANPSVAQVYKSIDENGNVIYTDKPLDSNSELVKLRPISVIEAPAYQLGVKANEENTEGGIDKEIPLATLRKNYQDFAIISPQPEESFWGLEGAVTVVWNTRYQLQDGMQAVIFIDADEYSKTTERRVSLEGLVRGEHFIEAYLIDKNEQKIVTAEPVIFFLRRPNIHSNRTGSATNSGG